MIIVIIRKLLKASLSKALDPEQHGLGELSARSLVDKKVVFCFVCLLHGFNSIILMSSLLAPCEQESEIFAIATLSSCTWVPVSSNHQGGLCGLAALYWALTDTFFTPSQVKIFHFLVVFSIWFSVFRHSLTPSLP